MQDVLGLIPGSGKDVYVVGLVVVVFLLFCQIKHENMFATEWNSTKIHT